MESLGTIVVYLGGAIFAAGLFRLIWRVTFSLRSRKGFAWWWMSTGAVLLLLGFTLPSREIRVETVRTLHDGFTPAYQFNEVHETEVGARCDQVYDAIMKTTADEILLFRTLTWIRRMGKPGPEHILNAPGDRPILEVATRTTFLRLAEQSGREIVVGTLVLSPAGADAVWPGTPEAFASIKRPGYAKATMNFLVEEIRAGNCRVRTETRVFATDATSRRRFATYWRMIYPGSSVIRHMWLRAIRLRALRAVNAP